MKNKRREELFLREFRENGGRVEMTMYGEDINEFSREELLGVINLLNKELELTRKYAQTERDFYEAVLKGGF